MSHREPDGIATRRTPSVLVAGLVVVVAVVAASFGSPLLSAAAPSSSPPSSPPGTGAPALPSPPGTTSTETLPRGHRGAVGRADGVLPGQATAFDEGYPGVADLDPALRRALRRATTGAADDGVGIFVESGWRSPEYQERLLRDAVSRYGSLEEAARWVATPTTSAHVSGDAVDVGPARATEWLSEHGSRYGLCQIYRNEPWHFELRPGAIDRGCPRMYADPTHDPRMRR